uniref:Pre-mRNA polyadenylation factor Fip1 domain-containing protein n=1 Tax=Anopheles atroparvus TaxID=41427 RepID=A0A182J8P9_ANOAO
MADEGNEDSWLYGGSHQDGIAGGDSTSATEADGAAGGKNLLWEEDNEQSSPTAKPETGDFSGQRRGSNDVKDTGDASAEGSSADVAGNGLSGHEQQCDDNAMDSSDVQGPAVGQGDDPDPESQDDSHLMDDDRTESEHRDAEKSGKRKQNDAGSKDGGNRVEAKDDQEEGEIKEKRKQSSGEEKDAGDDNGKDKGGLSDMESDIDSDEDDDINVVIGDIKSGPSYNIIKQRGPIMPNQAASNAAGVTDKTKQPAGKFSIEEFESVGSINGVPAHEFSIDSLDEKPWRKPGADITDYFNYGFNEETWRSYCERQKRMRQHESGVGMAGLTINNPQAAQPIGMNMGMRDMRRSGGPMGGGPMGGPRKMNGPIEVIGGGPGGPGGPMGGGPMGGGGGGRRDDGMGMSHQPKENVIQVMTADRREYSRTVVGTKFEPSIGGPQGFGGGPPDFYHQEADYSDYYDPMQEAQWGNDNGNWQPSGIKTLTPGPQMMGHPGMGGMSSQQQQHMDMMGGGGGERMVMPPPQQMQSGMVGGGPGMGPGGGRIHQPGMPPGARGDMRNPNDRKRGDPREQRDRDREREQRDRRDRERDRERERERDRDRERERERKDREHRSDREASLIVPKEEVVDVPVPPAVVAIPGGAPSGSAASGSRDDKDKRSIKPDRHKDRHRERSRSRERSKSRRSDRSREREQRHSRDKKKSHRKDKEDGE